MLIAFETAGQADGGKHRGTYLQLGVSPGVALMEKGPVPLGFVPAAFGTWQLKGGVTFLVLGDTLKDVNRGDGVEVIGTVGLAMTY